MKFGPSLEFESQANIFLEKFFIGAGTNHKMVVLGGTNLFQLLIRFSLKYLTFSGHFPEENFLKS